MLFFNLSAFYFFYFAAVGVYIIFLPKVLHDIGYSTFDIGIIFALAPLMRFITPFLFLKHIKLDQKMFKSALYISVFSSACFYLTIENFFLFMINNAILAACLSLILPYLEVTAISTLGKEKYGKSRLYGSIGFMIISLVLAKFLTQPFIAVHYYLVLNILTVIFALLLLKYDVQKIENENNEPFSFLKYWPFWMSLFFMQMSFGGFYNFFTIYETEHNISLEMTSYLWSFGVICEILMLYFQAPLLKNNLLNLIKICVGITIFRWFLLYLYPDSLGITFFTQSLHAFSFGLYHSTVIIYLYTLYENKKLAQQFMYGVAYGLGGFIGAFIAGAVYGEFLFLYSALFALLSFISLYFIKK
ncbi:MULTISPECIES: MFS transporter [Arcobacter]|jgi:PPP family 3-phenylpropionic acid transporter|uniref:MFS transporter n=1 Tax=Arcobacter ellisii TaxID=913109 RepID=A0A347UBZ7_9BACT|nr:MULTISPECIES: MFS transporter [Arcobacter]AXX96375.1 putative major facilitator superfamily transporter [Arcobacter ellisii]MDD3007231.1 MFS transporter [Arcobacter sp.]MDY3205582.1 MFS transporter [Arcobacter sp.]RXI32830.1 MFS transporter [Arcobacter ellisii]